MARLFLVALLVLTVPGGARAQAPITTQIDLIYGRSQGSALLADIAYPETGQDLPAIIYVHGGRWQGGSRNGGNALDVEQWAGLGFFAMTIDFRLVSGSPAPAPYQDVLTAVRWMHAHADEYRVDPDRIYLIGNSSGGHLVSLVATLGDGPFEKLGGWEDERSDVRAVISVSGAYDINALLSWGELWSAVEADRTLASPIRQVTSATRPILLLHSEDDQAVPFSQAQDMDAALTAAGVRHRFVRYQDRGHMSISDEVIEQARAFMAEIEQGQ
jgi:acetyl esterase/lipase